jgi:hypothetical protein
MVIQNLSRISILLRLIKLYQWNMKKRDTESLVCRTNEKRPLIISVVKK